MKSKVLFSLVLVFFLVVCLIFVACDSSSTHEVIAVCESDTSAGKVTIKFFQENPNKAVQSWNYYKITLNGSIISQGIIIISGYTWNFNPTSGNVQFFTATRSNGYLTILVIPYDNGYISDFGTQMIFLEGDLGDEWDPVA